MIYDSCLKQKEKQRKFMAEKLSDRGWQWVLILAVMAAAAGGCSRKQPLAYNTTTVTHSELTKLVTATGTLNPVVNVTVGSQVSGRISKLNVDFNSIVKSNQVIAEIDPSTYQAAVGQASADLANAMANLELQQVEANRSSDLFTNKLISGSDYDTAFATLHEAEATVKIKQASLSNAVVNLNYCKIVSPVDGVVILRAVELGQTVASSFSTPTIFQIANDLTKMQIDSSVAEADVGGVVEGQQVEFTVDAYPDRTFHGSVVQVRNSPTTVNNVVTYDCVIGVTNADYKLKPGMTANVSITVAQRENALTIPNGALRFRPPEAADVDTNSLAAMSSAQGTNGAENAAGGPAAGKSYGGGQGGHRGGGHAHGEHPSAHTIYLLVGDDKNQKLQAVQIKTGISDGIMTEVVSGLDEGAKVVTSVETPGATGGAPGGFGGGGGFPRMR
jgi:HlyD family secretion protein